MSIIANSFLTSMKKTLSLVLKLSQKNLMIEASFEVVGYASRQNET